MTTVVLADDQELVRSGFRLILMLAGIDVLGEAADGGKRSHSSVSTIPMLY